MYSGNRYSQRLPAAATINTRVSRTVNSAPNQSDAALTLRTPTDPSTASSLHRADDSGLISRESSGEEAKGNFESCSGGMGATSSVKT
jgi:hypothetical protein